MPIVEIPKDAKLEPLPPGFVEIPRDAKIDAAPQGPSRMERFGTGLMDPLVGMGQFAAHASPEMTEAQAMPFAPQMPDRGQFVDAVDKRVADREQGIQAERKKAGQTGTDWYRVAGQIASPPNLALAAVPQAGAATLLGRLGLAGLTGAASSAIDPVTQGDFWSEKAKQIAKGAGLGAAAGAGGEVVGRVIAPKISQGARALADMGIMMTPGQMLGGIPRRAEEAAKSLPILGNFIRNSEGRSLESFNRATINQALEPIGAAVPNGIRAGHEANAFAADTLNQAYDTLLPQMRFTVDRQFGTDLLDLRNLVQEMPPAQVTQFENLFQNRLLHRLQPRGTMDGQTLKQVESELRVFGNQYRGALDPAQRQLGDAVNQMRALLREGMMRQNPTQATQLRNIDSAYAMLVRVEDAARRRLGSEGVFSPTDLLGAIRSDDRSIRKRAFAHGDALMQEYATTAHSILPSKMPDSGTTERWLWDALGGLALGYGAHLDLRIPIAGAAASLPYTSVGQRAANSWMTPGPLRQSVGGVAEQLGLGAAPAAATAGTGPH